MVIVSSRSTYIEGSNTRDEDDEDDEGHDRRLDGNQPHAFQPEGDARRRSLLDDVDMDFAFAVLIEHDLSSPHSALTMSLLASAQCARMPITLSGLERQIAAFTVAICAPSRFTPTVFHGSPTQYPSIPPAPSASGR